MRRPEYLSYTSIKLWKSEGPRAFYRRYMADIRPTPPRQTLAMCAGSAFDACVKSTLAQDLLGAAAPERLSFEALFESSVEKHNRVRGRELASVLFDFYRRCGAYLELLEELERSPAMPRFEFTAGERVDGSWLSGKPDLVYSDGAGGGVVLDWKVNGMAASGRTSPFAGYYRVRGSVTGRENGQVRVDACEPFGSVNEEWATQLAIYGYLTGCEVCRVEQLCGPVGALRSASYRGSLPAAWVAGVVGEARAIWEIVNSDWIFRDMSEEESAELCARLDRLADDPQFEGLCGY